MGTIVMDPFYKKPEAASVLLCSSSVTDLNPPSTPSPPIQPPRPLTLSSMATISSDSEFMTQYVAAVAIPPSSYFVTVDDGHGKPMIFSLGTDKKFHLIVNDVLGNHILVDFGVSIGYSGNIHSFYVQQGASGMLYIVVAVADSSSTTGASELVVVQPFNPSDYDLTQARLDALVIPHKPQANHFKVTKLSLGSTVDVNDGYPDVLLSYLDEAGNADIARLSIKQDESSQSTTAYSWTLLTDIQLPVNASAIIDTALGTLSVGRGLFILYEIQGQEQIAFVTLEKRFGQTFQTILGTPPGAHRITTVDDIESGETDLLIAGAGLWRLTHDLCVTSFSQPTRVSSDPLLQGIEELLIDQQGTLLTIWVENSDHTMAYLHTTADFPTSGVAPAVPLVPSGGGAGFAAMRSKSTGVQSFFLTDDNSKISRLEQDPVSRLWKNTPFFTPALNENIIFTSFTTHISLTAADDSPLTDVALRLRSSGWVSIIVNGRNVSVGPDGLTIRTDSHGVVTLIIPTEDISSYTFTLDDVPGKNSLSGQSFSVDPSTKIQAALASIQSGDDLKDAKTKSGKPLIESDLSKDDMDGAAGAISKMHKTLGSFSGPNDAQLTNFTTTLGTDASTFVADSLSDGFWDAFHWVEHQLNKIEHWAVEVVGGVTNFIMKIAGKVMIFVLNTALKVLKAISWVFKNVLGIDISKLLDWLGFLFVWGDIIDTKNSIVALANSALTFGASAITGLAPKVDGFFDSIEKEIRNAVYPDSIKNAVAGSRTGATASGPNGATPANTKAVANTAPGNFSQYQWEHGGARDASVVKGGTNITFENFYDDILKPIFDSFENSVATIGGDIINLFSQSNSISAEAILQKLVADIVIAFLDPIKTLSGGLIKLGADIVTEMQDYFNCEIDIPVIGALYKFISGGSSLTILDGLALLIAIPTTLLYKVAHNDTPPDLTNINVASFFGFGPSDPSMSAHAMDMFSVLAPVVIGFSAVTSIGSLSQITDFSATSNPHARDQLASAWKGSALAFANANERKPLHEMLSIGNPFSLDFDLFYGMFLNIYSMPCNPSQPDYFDRLTPWIISVVSTLTQSIARKYSEVAKKPLIVIHFLIGSCVFAINADLCGRDEKNAKDGADTALASMRGLSAILNFITSASGAVASLTDDPDAAAVKLCAQGANLLLYVVMLFTSVASSKRTGLLAAVG